MLQNVWSICLDGISRVVSFFSHTKTEDAPSVLLTSPPNRKRFREVNECQYETKKMAKTNHEGSV
jgi:hypothetical protein